MSIRVWWVSILVVLVGVCGPPFLSLMGLTLQPVGTGTAAVHIVVDEIPTATALPATCTVGQIYMDTDALSGRRLYLCESANTWVAQGGSAVSAGIYNVKDYGAVGDGVADDTAAIIATFTAAPNGSLLFFPEGTYLASEVNLSSARHNLTIQGTGRGSIWKRKPGVSGDTGRLLYFSGNSHTGITVRDMAFDLNNCLSFCGGIRMGKVPRLQILHNYVFDSNLNLANNNDKFGIIVQGDGSADDLHGRIHGNVIDDCQVELDNISGLIVSENIVSRPRSTAGIGYFSLSGSSGYVTQNHMILNNVINDALVSAGAITVHLDPANATNYTYRNFVIRGNRIRYATASSAGVKDIGIRWGTSNSTTATTNVIFDNFTVEDNMIYFADTFLGQPWGMEMMSGTIPAFFLDNMRIRNNIIRLTTDAGGQGTDLRYARGLVLTGNILYNIQATRDGLGVAFSDTMVIADNLIYGVATADPIVITNTGGFGNDVLLTRNHARGPTGLYTVVGTVPATFVRHYDQQAELTWNATGCSAMANGGKITLTAGNVLECDDDLSATGSGVDTGTTGALPYYASDGALVSPSTVTWVPGTTTFTVPGTAIGTTALIAGTPDASGVRLGFLAGPSLSLRRGDNGADASVSARGYIATSIGTAGTPALRFTDDPNTGLYGIAVDQLGVATNGVLRLTISTIGALVAPPAAQTIGAAGTVAADACGGLKLITAAGPVTTDTTNTFTAPAAANTGCLMTICNSGAQTITLDTNALFKSVGGADIVLTADDCTQVGSDGTVWRSTGPLVAN